MFHVKPVTEEPHSLRREPRDTAPLLITLAGVMAIASAAIFIRLSEAPALATAFYRLLFSSMLMTALLTLRRPKGPLHMPWRYTIPAGLALGAHFWLWMRSLEFTSVLVSTLFVTTTPLWLALAAPLLKDEATLSRSGWMGLCTALAGACLLALTDATTPSAGTNPLLGAFLATAGAWAIAAYLALTRRARRSVTLLPYSAATTGIGAGALFLPMLVTQTSFTQFPAQTWLWIVALAVVPQLVGHNALVWAVRFVGATTVAMVVLLEPLGSGLLAFLLFDEHPTLLHGAAALVLLAGLAVVLRSRPSQ